MQIPLQISFQGMEPSPAIEARIRKKAAKLERFHDRIVGCRVVVEAPHRQNQQGKLYHGKLYNVRIDLSMPGKDIVIGGSGPQRHANEDVYAAIRDAFNAAGRRLQDRVRRRRGDVKTHTVPDHGKITQLLDDYGFIETPDGEEIYFHKNSVVDADFYKLEVGNEVRLVIAEEEGVKGAQASSVTPLGKRHIVE